MRILVTGVNRGLGKAIAESLSAQHDVIGTVRTPIDDCYPRITYIHGIDFQQEDTLLRLSTILPQCDALINNVGIAKEGILATQAIADIKDCLQVNLLSTLLLTKYYLRARLSQKRAGNIINISSIISIRGYAGLSVYSATKAGLNGMTQSLAREMGPKGFRINAILPGYFESAMSAKLTATQVKQIINRTPLHRLATANDIIPTISFLLSEQSSFITGQTIVIDGGITL